MIQLTGYNVHLCEETVSPSSRRDKDDRVLESIDIPAKFKSIPNDRYISKIYREGVYRFIPRYVILSTLLLLAYFLLRREIDGSDHLAFNTVHLHSVHV